MFQTRGNELDTVCNKEFTEEKLTLLKKAKESHLFKKYLAYNV